MPQRCRHAITEPLSVRAITLFITILLLSPHFLLRRYYVAITLAAMPDIFIRHYAMRHAALR